MGIIQEKRDANKPAVEQTGYGVTRVNVSESIPADNDEKREEVVADVNDEAAAVVDEQTATSSSAAVEEAEMNAEEPAPIPVPKKGRPKKKSRR